jgi:2-amino-4-hydroxy-6-hydroxymethyldihydropteridine diphosphokinase
MSTAFLGLGANLGERLVTLQGARRALAHQALLEIAATSPLYETTPVGGPPGQDLYFNAVLQVNTILSAQQLLACCRAVEDLFARSREQRWGARTLDIDLLLYGSLVLDEPALQLPHPRLHLRRFVLAPLADLAPQLPHPQLGNSIGQLLAQLQSDETVSLLCQEW